MYPSRFLVKTIGDLGDSWYYLVRTGVRVKTAVCEGLSGQKKKGIRTQQPQLDQKIELLMRMKPISWMM
jgi:hypothetical protein